MDVTILRSRRIPRAPISKDFKVICLEIYPQHFYQKSRTGIASSPSQFSGISYLAFLCMYALSAVLSDCTANSYIVNKCPVVTARCGHAGSHVRLAGTYC